MSIDWETLLDAEDSDGNDLAGRHLDITSSDFLYDEDDYDETGSSTAE